MDIQTIGLIGAWIGIIVNFLLLLAVIQRLTAETKNTGMGITNSLPPQIMDRILSPSSIAPDFELLELDGKKQISSSQFIDQYILMVIISPDCSACAQYLPRIIEFYSYARQQKINLLLISLGQVDDTKIYVSENNINIPVYIAPRNSSSFYDDYKAIFTPMYYYINSKRIITHGGAILDNDWKSIVKLISKGTLNPD